MKAQTLLLIEDNPGDARLFQEMLSELRGDYRITWVQTLAEALKEIAQHRYQLILCDLNLPDSRGLETAAAVIAAASGEPIIVLTGQNDDQMALGAIKAGAQDYLLKNTVTPDLIDRTIRYAIERKRADGEKMKLQAQLIQAQKMEAIGTMAGAIAHHFNNQLQAVMGNLEMAMDNLPRVADISEALAEAMQAARKAAEISRLMLTYLGQTPGKHEPIDLSETCRQSLTLLQAAAPKGMILKADFPSSGPVVRAYTNQMYQVLTNLVTNAWEATAENKGDICLTVTTVSHEDIPALYRFPIGWQPQKIAYACLEVSDTGCGISNKDIEKIFDPFFTTKFIGRGLGLPVVMGIVKAHGGGVTVDSEPGRGSVFRIFLPATSDKIPCQPDLPAVPGARPTGKADNFSGIEGVGTTVLLIEDEEQVRKMAIAMLTHLGYRVLEAKDGIHAVEIFKQHQHEIHCVLTDLTLPHMDGWETLTALRLLSPNIPVILCSGYGEAQVMSGEHTEQPDAFLGKPYQLKGLRETISRTLVNKKNGITHVS